MLVSFKSRIVMADKKNEAEGVSKKYQAFRWKRMIHLTPRPRSFRVSASRTPGFKPSYFPLGEF